MLSVAVKTGELTVATPTPGCLWENQHSGETVAPTRGILSPLGQRSVQSGLPLGEQTDSKTSSTGLLMTVLLARRQTTDGPTDRQAGRIQNPSSCSMLNDVSWRAGTITY